MGRQPSILFCACSIACRFGVDRDRRAFPLASSGRVLVIPVTKKHDVVPGHYS
jgi:hypothetical protein